MRWSVLWAKLWAGLLSSTGHHTTPAYCVHHRHRCITRVSCSPCYWITKTTLTSGHRWRLVAGRPVLWPADGHPWLAARYLLPMTGAGNLSATLLESLYRHAQSRSNQSLLPHSSGGGVPAYNSQRGDARANSRKREAGGGGGGSTADAAATTHAATSDKSNKSRRGGRGGRGRGGGGAGAAQNGAAGAQG